jgi:hypothetical protein
MVTRRTVRPTAARSIWWPGLRRGVWVQTILRVSRVACWPGLLRFTRLSTNVEPYLDLSGGLGAGSGINPLKSTWKWILHGNPHFQSIH